LQEGQPKCDKTSNATNNKDDDSDNDSDEYPNSNPNEPPTDYPTTPPPTEAYTTAPSTYPPTTSPTEVYPPLSNVKGKVKIRKIIRLSRQNILPIGKIFVILDIGQVSSEKEFANAGIKPS